MGKTDYKITSRKKNGQKAFPKTLVEAIVWDKNKMKLEDVLESLIRGGGGGGQGSALIGSTADWGEIPVKGQSFSTAAEAAAYAGITEEQLDAVLNGELCVPIKYAVETTYDDFVSRSENIFNFNRYTCERSEDGNGDVGYEFKKAWWVKHPDLYTEIAIEYEMEDSVGTYIVYGLYSGEE